MADCPGPRDLGTADPEASVLLAEEAKELAAATGSPLYLAEAETTLGDALAAAASKDPEPRTSARCACTRTRATACRRSDCAR